MGSTCAVVKGYVVKEIRPGSSSLKEQVAAEEKGPNIGVERRNGTGGSKDGLVKSGFEHLGTSGRSVVPLHFDFVPGARYQGSAIGTNLTCAVKQLKRSGSRELDNRVGSLDAGERDGVTHRRNDRSYGGQSSVFESKFKIVRACAGDR